MNDIQDYITLRDVDVDVLASHCSVLIYVTSPDVGLFFIAKVGHSCLRVTVGIKSTVIFLTDLMYCLHISVYELVCLDNT